MNICLIITNLNGGGAERALIDLANALLCHGHKVKILLLENKIDHEIPRHLDINILQKKEPYLHGFIGKRLLAKKLKKEWATLNKKNNFDLTISRLPFSNEIVKLANLPNPYFIIDTHLSDEIKKISKKNKFKAYRIKKRYQRIYSKNNLIAVSKNVADDLKINFKNSNVHQIYNPIDIKEIKKKAKIKTKKIPKFPYVIHIGRAIDAKRHDLLLDAWSLVKTKCKLILITDDVLKIELMVKKRHLENRVQIEAFQTNPYPWIANAKLLVLCSDFEGFGLVLIEAKICNTPILSTNFGAATSEIFDGRYTKHLTPRGNKFALAKAIKKQLNGNGFNQPLIDFESYSFKKIAFDFELLKKDKTALFLKAKNIGDSIILTSAINALSDDYKYIDVLCHKDSENVFKMHPRVRNIFILPRHLNGFSKFKAYWQLIKNLSLSKYDTFIQFSDDWRGALIARLKRIPLRISRQSNRRGAIWHKSFDIISPTKSERFPSCEKDVNLLRSANLTLKIVAPKYTLEPPPQIQEKAKQWIKSIFKPSKNKIILIHAPARWSFKQIPIATWVEVIDQLHRTNKINILLNGSKSDFIYNQSIAKKCQKKPIILQCESIIECAAIMQQADLILSIDSMAIHLASALNKKVIAIFGPTDEANWAPWRVKHKIITLNKEYSCRPCGRDGCNGSKISECLINLPAKLILDGINQTLKY